MASDATCLCAPISQKKCRCPHQMHAIEQAGRAKPDVRKIGRWTSYSSANIMHTCMSGQIFKGKIDIHIFFKIFREDTFVLVFLRGCCLSVSAVTPNQGRPAPGVPSRASLVGYRAVYAEAQSAPTLKRPRATKSIAPQPQPTGCGTLTERCAERTQPHYAHPAK